jgi:hypothetical protein
MVEILSAKSPLHAMALNFIITLPAGRGEIRAVETE